MPNNVFQDRVRVAVKIEDMIIQSYLQWYGHVICQDINSQIHEVMELEITGRRKKGPPRKLWKECIKKDLEQNGLKREDVYDREKWQEQINKKNCQPPPAEFNGIKKDIVVVMRILLPTTYKGQYKQI